MTPSLSCTVMAHPRRKVMVDELLGWLDRPVDVTWDQHDDRHDTGLRAMTAYDPTRTHHLVVQDDVVPCRDLIAGAERALKWVPQDVPVSLYIGKVKPFRSAVAKVTAAAEGASWITMAGIYWGPAVILPTHLIDEMADSYRTSQVQNYDRRMSTWSASRRLRCWYSWPSLVDHRGDESLISRRHAGRHAHRFAGDVSALSLDWSGAVLEMAGTERLDRHRQRLAAKGVA